jgi:3-hydroxybutyryl-CoA dehydrogenase
VAGSGTIATGLAACATAIGPVKLLARSDESAWRAEEAVEKLAGKVEGADAANLKVTTDLGDIADCDLVVEAIAEDLEVKGPFVKSLAEAAPQADLASTTSSFKISQIADASGTAGRLFGLHVFNPVPRMELVELCLPEGLRDGTAERAHAFIQGLGKTAVEVPDKTGFIVNRLLFDYLFDAVQFMEQTGLEPEAIDTAMKLGTGHPMGPLALIDLVGIDVSVAIGDQLYAASGADHHEPPERLRQMLEQGHLGRKTGKGFYEYD